MMFRTLSLALLQISFGLALNSQIYFPTDDNYYPYVTTRSVTEVKRQNVNPDPELLVSRSALKITLDINRAAQTTSGQLTRTSNFAFGPITILGVLALVLLASAGQTFNEIVNFMGLNYGFNIENDNLEVHRQFGLLSQKLLHHSGLNDMITYKTAIFVQEDYPIRREFQQAAKYFYESDVVSLNFKYYPERSYDYINSWVRNGTHGKITSLLESLPSSETKAIIAGVLYFKGVWENPFIPGSTNWVPFYINGRKHPSDRKVMMMYNGGEFPYYKDKQLNVEILGIPYKGRGSTMYVVIPNDSNLDRLKQLENVLTPNDIERLINSTKIAEVVLGLPKMTVSHTVNLLNTMQYLGIRSLFDSRTANLGLLSPSANFKRGFALVPPPTAPPPPRTTTSNLNHELIFARFGEQSDCDKVYDYYTRTIQCRNRQIRAAPEDFLQTLRSEFQKYTLNPSLGSSGLYADHFLHKIVMDINEVGTEAAATTGIGISRSAKVTVRCDVPFLFFIYQEDTKMILFWGSIKSPDPSIPNNHN